MTTPLTDEIDALRSEVARLKGDLREIAQTAIEAYANECPPAAQSG